MWYPVPTEVSTTQLLPPRLVAYSGGGHKGCKSQRQEVDCEIVSLKNVRAAIPMRLFNRH